MTHFNRLTQFYWNFEQVFLTLKEHFKLPEGAVEIIKLLIVASSKKNSLRFEAQDPELKELIEDVRDISTKTLYRYREHLRDYYQRDNAVRLVDRIQDSVNTTYDLNPLAKMIDVAFDKVHREFGSKKTSYGL